MAINAWTGKVLTLQGLGWDRTVSEETGLGSAKRSGTMNAFVLTLVSTKA